MTGLKGNETHRGTCFGITTFVWLAQCMHIFGYFLTDVADFHQHKLSKEDFIAVEGTLVSVFGTLNSEAELHFTFRVLLKQ